MKLNKSKLQFHWGLLFRAVVLPLIVTRLALLLIGWFSIELTPDSDYPIGTATHEGWQYSPYRMLDIWGRWDTGFYDSIARNGYTSVTDPSSQQSNLAFFPLYPTLIRVVTSLIPGTPQAQEILLAGVLISNLCLFGAMVTMYQLSMDLFSDQKIAEKSILYMLFFPAGFFLSVAYTESLFIFCVLLAFFAGQRRIWSLAGIAGFCAVLTRSPGILLFPALFWLYMEQKIWSFRRIDFRILFLALIPTALLLVLWNGYNITGDWLAPLNAQAAWQRHLTWPWVTLFAPLDNSRPHFNQIEWVSLVLFIALSVFALIRLPSRSYGIYALLSLVPILLSGSLTSITRLSLAIFPAFWILAKMGTRKYAFDLFISVIFISLQAVLFAGWSQFYWAG
jgi:hypothetical protein